MSETPDEDCVCQGTGEIETIARDVLGCPLCIAQEKNEIIALRDARIADLEAALRDAWRPKLEWREGDYFIGSVYMGQTYYVADGVTGASDYRAMSLGAFDDPAKAKAAIERAARTALGMEPQG